MITTLILGLISFVLYIVGFCMSIPYIIIPAFALAIISFAVASVNITDQFRTRALRVGCACLIIVGIVFFVVLLVSNKVIVPFIDSLL